MSQDAVGPEPYGHVARRLDAHRKCCLSFEVEKIALEPSPINRDWILEGDPHARAILLSRSAGRYRKRVHMGLHRRAIQLVLRRG